MAGLSNIVVGGFWVASAIKVFDNTWTAMTSTYNQFPDVGHSPESTAAKVINTAEKVGYQAAKTGIKATVPPEQPLQPANTKGGILDTVASGAKNALGYIIGHQL